MTPDPLSEPLSKLDKQYQILTELHHCTESRTYLARALELNRDVTITVAHADGGDKAFLSAFAADAEILKAKHHPSLIPVLAGMWLDDQTFALVRARVRGSTLDQTMAAASTLPQPRIAEALNELTDALIWARDAGVTNRCIEPQTFVFQQGTGRVLIGFEPSRLIASDAATIESLARTMNGGAPLNVGQYTSRLGPLPVTSVSAAAIPPVNEREVVVPVGSDVAVVERRTGMSFGARVLTTFGVIAAILVGAFLLFQRGGRREKMQANQYVTDQRDAAGSLATTPDTAAAYSDSYRAPVVPPPPPPNLDSIARENEQRIAQAKAEARAMTSLYGTPSTSYPSPDNSSLYPTMPAPAYSPSTSPSPSPSTSASTRAQSRPGVDSTPVATTMVTRPSVDSAGRAELLDPCGSPLGPDQSHCLKSAIDRADRPVNDVYRRLIQALRRQAGVSDGDPDPVSVADLRAAQQRWVEERESSCRSAGSGLFYAKDRASCYADRSTARQAELQRQLDGLP
jgi:uncharacterized protein YecT (DUF1311 family)